ncbi:hypothetical protein HY623_01750 [Candidatus Uhrbacteria bacterium]|nr:hypothetical protein [Candidatus Uhrbacteria bacterium]
MKKKKQDNEFYQFYHSNGPADSRDHAFKKASRPSLLIRVIGALFVGLLAASAWVGYLYFSNRIGGSSDPIIASAAGPQTIETGTVVEYVFEYQNQGRSAVSDVALFAEYPIGFAFIESEPASQNSIHNYWNIGTLQPRGTGRIIVRGTLTGFENDERKAVFSLSYQHPLYRSAFTVKKEVRSVIGAATIERLRLEAPSTVNAGSSAQITIHYQEVTRLGNPENIFLKLSLPEGLTIESSDPEVSVKESNEWNGYALSKTTRPNIDGGVLRVTVKAHETLQGLVPVGVQLMLRESGRADAVLRESKSDITILRNDVSLSLVTEGADTLRALRPQSSQRLAVTIANKGNVTLRNLEVMLALPKDGIDHEKSVFDGGAERREQVVIWSAERVDSLKEMPSGAQVVLPLTIALGSSAQDAPLEFGLNARVGERVEKDRKVNQEPLKIDGPRISAAVLSDARVRAFLRDMSDAGQSDKKRFRVYLAVTNTLHDLDDLTVNVALPSSAEWGGVNSRTAGDIGIDAAARAVTWRLNALPASVKRIDASFDILVPTAQLGSDTRLVENIVFRVHDRIVGENIEQTIEGLTSLQTDESL